MRCFTNERPKAFDERCYFSENFVCTQRLLAEQSDDAVSFLQIALDPQLKDIRRHSIGNTNSAAARLVFISRPDAPQRRTDLFIPEPFLRCVIERSMIRHYQVR